MTMQVSANEFQRMDLFSEVLLCEDALITDIETLLSRLQVVLGPSPLDSVYYAKSEGPRWVPGRPRVSRGALGLNCNA